MTALDWIIIVVAIAAAMHGALRGFLAGSLALAGFLGGAWLGSRLGPMILHGGDTSPWSPLVALGGALLLGGLMAVLFETIGLRARRGFRATPLAAADAILGALLGGIVALGLAWLAGAVALQTPGVRTLRAEVQRSEILQALNEALPPSGAILRALARFDPLPSISGPTTTTLSAPNAAILRKPGVARASGGVVRILGAACGLGIEGSGWLAAPNVVVTNAHVVAGTDGDVVVRPRSGGVTLPARALAFDPRNDVAVLAVPGLSGPVLRMVEDPAAGTAGALLGYPHNGPFDVEPARIGQARSVISQDAYGEGPVERPMTPVRGLLRPGNSGGPIVDARGRVLTTVFAASREGETRGGYGVPNSVVQATLERVVTGGGASVLDRAVRALNRGLHGRGAPPDAPPSSDVRRAAPAGVRRERRGRGRRRGRPGHHLGGAHGLRPDRGRAAQAARRDARRDARAPGDRRAPPSRRASRGDAGPADAARHDDAARSRRRLGAARRDARRGDRARARRAVLAPGDRVRAGRRGRGSRRSTQPGYAKTIYALGVRAGRARTARCCGA